MDRRSGDRWTIFIGIAFCLIAALSWAGAWNSAPQNLYRIAGATTVLLAVLYALIWRHLRSRPEVQDGQDVDHYRSLFENSPISQKLEDFSGTRAYLCQLHKNGISDLNTYLDDHPEAIQEGLSRIRVLDVNGTAVKIHRQPDRDSLLGPICMPFLEQNREIHKRELIAIAEGCRLFELENVINILPSGERQNINISCVVMPGYENTWERVIVTIVDVTAQKQAEASLRESEQKYRELYAAAQRQAQDTALMVEVRLALANELDLQSFFQTVVEAISRTYGYTLVSLYMVEGDLLVLRHEVGYPEPILQIPITQGITGRTVRTGEPILVQDTTQSNEFLEAVPGIQSEVCAPLYDQNRIVGVLNAESKGPVPLSQNDLRIITEISEHVSIAINRVRLYSEAREAEATLRRQNEYLNALHETALGLINRLDLQDLLETTVQRATQLFGGNSGILYLVDPVQGDLEIRVGTGTSKKYVGRRIKPGEGLPGQVLVSGRPLIVDDYQRWEGRSAKYPSEDFQAAIGVPLSSGNKIVGVLGITYREPNPTLDEDQIEGLIRFAQLASIALENARLVAAMQQELAERERVEEQLRHDTMHDSLTGLPNRFYFMERLGRTIRPPSCHSGMGQQAQAGQARRSGNKLSAVLFLDIDRFKLVNDSLGHASGDRMLQEIANRLVGCLRLGDVIAHFSGDEFAFLLEDLDSIQDAVRVVERIQQELAIPFHLNGHEVFSSGSIGISLTTNQYETAQDMLRDADTAMYRAKANGRSTYQIFDQEMHAQSMNLLRLEGELRRAIERNEFCVYYQPIVSLRTGQISLVEALIRWQHPQRGLILPPEFISLAEETGLIVPIGQWILKAACQQVRAWHAMGFTSLQVAVNISARQFQEPGLPETIRSVLAETGIPATALHLEITESTAMQDHDLTIRTMDELDRMGLQISIDDFGTSYSSLGYLKRFPVANIKIDRSFIRDIPGDTDDAEITSAIIAMGHILKLEVIAEGVETDEQLAFLARRECDAIQGFLISRPIPADQMTQMLHGEMPQLVCPPGAARALDTSDSLEIGLEA